MTGTVLPRPSHRRLIRASRGHDVFLRAGVVAVAAIIGVSAGEAGQGAPNLNRQQRAALQMVVSAAATATEMPVTPDADWPLHVLRASDGSHYVAFTINSPPGLMVNRPVVLYVRMATRARDSAAP